MSRGSLFRTIAAPGYGYMLCIYRLMYSHTFARVCHVKFELYIVFNEKIANMRT